LEKQPKKSLDRVLQIHYCNCEGSLIFLKIGKETTGAYLLNRERNRFEKLVRVPTCSVWSKRIQLNPPMDIASSDARLLDNLEKMSIFVCQYPIRQRPLPTVQELYRGLSSVMENFGDLSLSEFVSYARGIPWVDCLPLTLLTREEQKMRLMRQGREMKMEMERHREFSASRAENTLRDLFSTEKDRLTEMASLKMVPGVGH
jgi:hypothetical protein